MKKKGFTLVELLGVITILALICILAFPPILDSIRKSKDNISKTTQEIIYGASNIYISKHMSLYPLIENNTYCIKLQDMVDDGDLIGNLKDASSGESINMNNYVIVLVSGNKYTFELDDECSS